MKSLGLSKGLGICLKLQTILQKKLFRGVLEYLPPMNRTIIFNTLFNNLCFDSLKRVSMAPFLFSQDYELFDNKSLFAIVKLRG